MYLQYIYTYDMILSNMLVDVRACGVVLFHEAENHKHFRTQQSWMDGLEGAECAQKWHFCLGLVIFPLLTIPRHIFQSLCCSITRHPVCCWSMLVRMDADGLLLVPLVTSTCSLALRYHPWKLTAKAPEHQWLEDDWFCFGARSISRVDVSFRVRGTSRKTQHVWKRQSGQFGRHFGGGQGSPGPLIHWHGGTGIYPERMISWSDPVVLSLRLRLEERLQNLQGGSGRCQACCVIQGYWKTNSLIILIQLNTHLLNFTGYVFLVPLCLEDWRCTSLLPTPLPWLLVSQCCCGILELNLLHHIGSILDILKFCRVMKVVTTYRVDVTTATQQFIGNIETSIYISLAIIIEPGSFSFLLHFLRY